MILAIDPSLTASGYARGPLGSAPTLGVLHPPREVGKEIGRLVWIRDQVVRLAEGCDMVVLEGYSYASKGRSVVSLGELGGVVRVALTESGVPYCEVAPSGRAKYATGKGGAGKEEVLSAAIQRFGYTGHNTNEADALVLWAMAAEAMGDPFINVPKAHKEALEAVAWPIPQPVAR